MITLPAHFQRLCVAHCYENRRIAARFEATIQKGRATRHIEVEQSTKQATSRRRSLKKKTLMRSSRNHEHVKSYINEIQDQKHVFTTRKRPVDVHKKKYILDDYRSSFIDRLRCDSLTTYLYNFRTIPRTEYLGAKSMLRL